MNQELAFLAAIRRRPASRADRLVYADWLMERGDPRGEFVSVQVQGSSFPTGSPRRLDLDAAAHDLLAAHEAEWLGPLAGVIDNWQWRGGMLDWVTLNADAFLASGERFLPALPLLGVHLRKAQPHVAALARFKPLVHVTGLYLGSNQLTDDDLAVLLRSRHLTQVRSLYLQSNRLQARAAMLLAEASTLPRLRELCLGHNWIRDQGVAHLAAGPRLARLRSLNLSMAGLTEVGVRTLAESPLLARLRVLRLALNDLPPGALAVLAGAPAVAGLRGLHYSLNRTDDADVIALAGSPHVAGLRHLSLEGGQGQGDAALRALAESSALGALRSLNLGRCGASGARALGRSRTLTSLRSLRLLPEGELDLAKAFLGQPLAGRLRSLDLPDTRLSTEALKRLASHSRPLRFRELSLPLSGPQTAPFESLLKRQSLPALTALTLVDPPPGSLKAILPPRRLPELRHLTLQGLPSLEEFQALLDSALPRRLHELHVDLAHDDAEAQGLEVVRRLTKVWQFPSLRRLGLLWPLTPKQVQVVAAAPCPPALSELELGSFALRAKGMAALAGSPLLRQLKRLVLSNVSSEEVSGLEALIDSPHVGPLLRVEIRNGYVPRETLPAIRRRFGGRVATDGRAGPQTIILGGGFGDDD